MATGGIPDAFCRFAGPENPGFLEPSKRLVWRKVTSGDGDVKRCRAAYDSGAAGQRGATLLRAYTSVVLELPANAFALGHWA